LIWRGIFIIVSYFVSRLRPRRRCFPRQRDAPAGRACFSMALCTENEMRNQHLHWSTDPIDQIRDESTPPQATRIVKHRCVRIEASCVCVRLEKIGNPAACERLGVWNLQADLESGASRLTGQGMQCTDARLLFVMDGERRACFRWSDGKLSNSKRAIAKRKE
jgi:hypothetical protein